MGRRDRERKERIRQGREQPFTAARSVVEPLIRPIGMTGRFAPQWARDLKAATKEETVRLVGDYVRPKGFVPRIEEDEPDSVTIGMYCKHGVADIAVVFSEDEDTKEWDCLELQSGISDTCRCHARLIGD
jgi:hypothetical protein